MLFFAFGLYAAACVLCGIMGRNTTIGFMGHFLLSLYLSPVVDFIVQAVGRPSTKVLAKLHASKPR